MLTSFFSIIIQMNLPTPEVKKATQESGLFAFVPRLVPNCYVYA